MPDLFGWLRNLLKWVTTHLGAFLAGFVYGKGYERAKEIKRKKENAEKQAQKWADADVISTPDRLRRLARKKRNS